MSKEKQSLKSGEKILFGIVAVFIGLAVIAYAALETYRMSRTEPLFVNKTHYNFTEEGHLGSRLFREARCTACHRALRNGTNMGLSLDGVGSLRSLDWLVAFLADPEATYGAKTFDHGPSPKEASYVAQLPEKDRHAIAVFISQLKSEQGSSSAPMPPEGRSDFIDKMVGAWAPAEWKDRYKDVRTKQVEKQTEESQTSESAGSNSQQINKPQELNSEQ
jgi:cytochrome c553